MNEVPRPLAVSKAPMQDCFTFLQRQKDHAKLALELPTPLDEIRITVSGQLSQWWAGGFLKKETFLLGFCSVLLCFCSLLMKLSGGHSFANSWSSEQQFIKVTQGNLL